MDKAAVAVLKQLKQELLGTIESPKFLIWGSYAQGVQTEWSDLDVVIVSDSFRKIPMHERGDYLFTLCSNVEPDIDPWGLTPDELAQAHRASYMGHARETGVWVDVS